MLESLAGGPPTGGPSASHAAARYCMVHVFAVDRCPRNREHEWLSLTPYISRWLTLARIIHREGPRHPVAGVGCRQVVPLSGLTRQPSSPQNTTAFLGTIKAGCHWRLPVSDPLWCHLMENTTHVIRHPSCISILSPGLAGQCIAGEVCWWGRGAQLDEGEGQHRQMPDPIVQLHLYQVWNTARLATRYRFLGRQIRRVHAAGDAPSSPFPHGPPVSWRSWSAWALSRLSAGGRHGVALHYEGIPNEA